MLRRPQQQLLADHTAVPSPYRERMLAHGIERLARKQPVAARQHWQRMQGQLEFEQALRYRVERALALGAVRSELPDRLQWLDAIEPAEEDTALITRRLRAALSDEAWQELLGWIEALPQALRESERWRYWRARSLESLGYPEQAGAIYSDLAGERSYYGFMAADRDQQPYRLDHVPLTVDPALVESLALQPALQRVAELVRLDRYVDARREWHMATAGLDDVQLMAAAKLAQRLDWHPQAIFTLARTEYWDDLELRFPLQHSSEVAQAAGRHQLDDEWIYAIIRQESAFASDARSSAGALERASLANALSWRIISRSARPT